MKKPVETVESLRQKGYKVKVVHVRHDFEGDEVNPRYRGSEWVWEKGGLTRVDVIGPDGKEAHAEALCGPRDNYNKKRGVQIALGRAMKKLLSLEPAAN